MSFVVLKDAETQSAYYSPNYHLNMSLTLQDFGVTRSGVKYSLEAYLVSANIPGPKKTSQTFVMSEWLNTTRDATAIFFSQGYSL